MRIRAERDDLTDVFTRAGRAIGARSAHPALQGLLCEVTGSAIKVTGTDLEMTVQTQAAVEVLEPGRVLIPGKLLESAVRKLPSGMVTLGATDSEIEILGRGPRFSLRPLAIDDFPNVSEDETGGTEVDGESLAQAISQVTAAAGSDSGRPILTGVLFETSDQGLRMVSTDSYRLAVRDLPGVGLGASGLVPARGLRELPRTIGSTKVRINLAGREAIFSSEKGSLRLRMIEGTFPKYRTLLPESYVSVMIVDREALLEALGRVSLVAEDHIPVRLTMGPGGVAVSVTRQDVGGETEHIDGEFQGGTEELLIAFNPRFLAEGVAAVATDRVQIQLIDGHKPSVITGLNDPDFLYLLMPVRL